MYQNKWFQDGPPQSYKIQIMYVDIPQHLRLKKKPVDTPFRFRNFEEAQQTASEMFSGYETKIVGSLDQPHWQTPEKRMTQQDMNKEKWYDIYGVTPAYQVQYRQDKHNQYQQAENEAVFQQISKVRPMAVDNFNTNPPKNENPKPQVSQTSQVPQVSQTGQVPK